MTLSNSRFIGNRSLYKNLLMLMIPMMIQNGITNFVNMLDNVMVGQVGTAEMTGVAVANQLIFVFNLCIFGAVSGAGIFGTQFFGKGDMEGVRHTFRFKLLICIGLAALSIVVFLLFGDTLLALYLRGEGDAQDTAAAFGFAKDYLTAMLFGLIPMALVQCYASTLRETGRPVVPMAAGLAAVLVNLSLNYVLIFGKFGAPALGPMGAAIATVISRFVELTIVLIWSHTRTEKSPFFKGVYRSLYVPKKLIGNIVIKGLPLMLNETFWAIGVALVNMAYSMRAYDVVAANNIVQTFFNIFAVAFQAAGVAIGIMLGQHLGANETERAREECPKMIAFSLFVSVIVAVLFFCSSFFIPNIYAIDEEVRTLTTQMMMISAFALPIEALANSCYFTLRAGGRTWITILFDSCFSCLIHAPLALCLSVFTPLPFLVVYALCEATWTIKGIVGAVLVKKGIWIRNIVDET